MVSVVSTKNVEDLIREVDAAEIHDQRSIYSPNDFTEVDLFLRCYQDPECRNHIMGVLENRFFCKASHLNYKKQINFVDVYRAWEFCHFYLDEDNPEIIEKTKKLIAGKLTINDLIRGYHGKSEYIN